MGSTNTPTDWMDNLDHGVTLDEANINEMVSEKFRGGTNGYNGTCAFTNGTSQYKLNTMLPDISKEFLTRMMEAKQVGRVQVGVAEGEFQYGF
jgi:hypothetical protein